MLENLLKFASIFNKLAGRWSEYIRGEWWIDKYGEGIFADQDVGDVGHEVIAVDNMLDKDILIDGLKQHYKKLFDSGEMEEFSFKTAIDRLEDYKIDEYGSSALYFNEEIPNDVGSLAAGGIEKWRDLKSDERMAYAKHEGAILVINTNFLSWEITPQTINAIQNFIYEQIAGEEITASDEEIIVEEAKSKKHISMPLTDFLNIKHPGEFWRYAST